ncbi:MAG: hypothetical protein EB101_04210 [Chitinophagia bacterium]|nr:hypothetical protein [Chitinophagia bacterium]
MEIQVFGLAALTEMLINNVCVFMEPQTIALYLLQLIILFISKIPPLAPPSHLVHILLLQIMAQPAFQIFYQAASLLIRLFALVPLLRQ